MELSCRQTVLLRRSLNGKLENLLRVQAGDLAGEARAYLDGEEVFRGGVRAGEAIACWIPEPAAPRAARVRVEADGEVREAEIALRVPRHWEVHLVQMSHHDPGYTDLMSHVFQRHYEWIDRLLDDMDARDGLPEDTRLRVAVEQFWSFYAALTLFGSLDGLTFSFLIGLCHASAVMIGKSVGAGDFAAARRDGVRFTRMVVCVAAGLGLFLIAIRDVALLPFGNVTGETRELVRGIIAVYGVEVALRNVPYITIVGVFRAGGDTKFGLRMDMLFLWCVSLPITFVCAYFFNMNLLLVYAVMLLSEDLPKSLMCLSRLRGDRWIRPVTEKGRAEAQPDPSSL